MASLYQGKAKEEQMKEILNKVDGAVRMLEQSLDSPQGARIFSLALLSGQCCKDPELICV
jgi:hypothetical protein